MNELLIGTYFNGLECAIILEDTVTGHVSYLDSSVQNVLEML